MNNVTHSPRLDPELQPYAQVLVQAQQTAGADPTWDASSSEAGFERQLRGYSGVSRTDWLVDVEECRVPLTIIQQARATSNPRPAVLFIHGGGMVSGDRFFGVGDYMKWVASDNVVLATVDYRLAPEHPDPAPVEDCYAAFQWLASHASSLGIDAGSILIVGVSAGGGLAAGVSLLARDRDGARPSGLMLRAPMLDDRDTSHSATQFEEGVWNRETNRAAWRALLGERCGGTDVSPYAAPARAADLKGLPSTYLDCGSSEVFRDEVVSFASRMWADGGDAELHVWAGGFHTFDVIAPSSALSASAAATADSWITRRGIRRG